MTFTELWGDVSTHLQDNFKIDPVLYVGLEKEHLKGSAIEKSPFYHVNDARLAKTLEGFQKAPLDATILTQFSEQQSIFYEMTSRFVLGKEAGTFEQRRRYYWEMLRIWTGIFNTLQPDLVINSSLPHRNFDYVVANICQQRDIPFIGLENTSIPDTIYVRDSIPNMSRVFAPSAHKSIELPELSQHTKDYLESVANPADDYRPRYDSLTGLFSSSRKVSFKQNIFNLFPQSIQILALGLKILLKGEINKKIGTRFKFMDTDTLSKHVAYEVSLLDYLILSFKANKKVNRAERWYKINIEEVDYNKPYIYFPANFQPERSTVPDVGYFYDFPLILSMLDRKIPKDWQIIYKEHPRIFHKPTNNDNPRDIDFYLRVKESCPRIKFVTPKEDSKKLIKNCTAVACTQSTSGWEALARGKPAMVFGDCWYSLAKGAFKIKSLKNLEDAIEFIQKNITVEKQDIIDYLKIVEHNCSNLAYYFKDNVAERASMVNNTVREFTPEERQERTKLSKKIASFLATYLQKNNVL